MPGTLDAMFFQFVCQREGGVAVGADAWSDAQACRSPVAPQRPIAMASAEDFRRIALAFPGAEERAHMGHPDFRVGGKIFATLHAPEKGTGAVMLLPEQQELAMEAEPDAFSPAAGAWGRGGSTVGDARAGFPTNGSIARWNGRGASGRRRHSRHPGAGRDPRTRGRGLSTIPRPSPG